VRKKLHPLNSVSRHFYRLPLSLIGLSVGWLDAKFATEHTYIGPPPPRPRTHRKRIPLGGRHWNINVQNDILSTIAHTNWKSDETLTGCVNPKPIGSWDESMLDCAWSTHPTPIPIDTCANYHPPPIGSGEALLLLLGGTESLTVRKSVSTGNCLAHAAVVQIRTLWHLLDRLKFKAISGAGSHGNPSFSLGRPLHRLELAPS
jgi:hypothetical protein